VTPVEVIAAYLADIHHDRPADPVRRRQAEDLLAELAGAGHAVVSAEDLDVAIAYAARDQDGERSPCVARLRAALPERTADA
jgi:hypothetical protein